MEKVDTEGVITVEEGKSLETELEVVEGMQMVRSGWTGFYIKYGEGRLPMSFTAAHPEARSIVRPARWARSASASASPVRRARTR